MVNREYRNTRPEVGWDGRLKEGRDRKKSNGGVKCGALQEEKGNRSPMP